MPRPRKKVYITAGYNTISLGTGRKEFNPKKPRPGLEHYIKEAGQAVLEKIGGADKVDETVISNFNAPRYNKQGNMAAFAPYIDEGLRFKPSVSVEGACGSGGLAVTTAIRSVLAETADVVLTLGVEVQNTKKAVYGADYLANAGWFKFRKEGHAHFFPGQFSDRAGVYFDTYGFEYARKGMGRWYRNMIENARRCPTAQEYHNTTEDLEAKYHKTLPNGKVFVDNLTVYDCSKVSDAASALVVTSEEGLAKIGIPKHQAVEVISFANVIDNLTEKPRNPLELTAFKTAVERALADAGITIKDIGTIELHDCFTIAAVLAVEAMGFAKPGEGAQFIYEGHTAHDGDIPMNTTGGLIGWGHPVGATGVHMAVTIWQQLTENAGEAQIKLDSSRPYGLSVNMGGDDKTLTAIVYKRAE